MKHLTIILLFSVSLSFGQNLNSRFNNEDFSKEFIRLVDSTRKSLYNKREVSYLNPKWKDKKYRNSKKAIKWISEYYEYNTNIDSNASSACEHHNKYMYNLVLNIDKDPIVIGHTEETNGMAGYTYNGTDTLLYSSIDRCKYYGDVFKPYGECVWAGYTTYHKYKNMTSVELARATYNKFMESKIGHREILISPAYTDCGISLTIDPENKRFYVTYITGKLNS